MNPERENITVGTPTMGDPTVNHIKNTALDANAPIQGGAASIGTDYAFGGQTKSASTSGPTGLVETTASTENLSAKYKYPNVSQDTVSQDMVAKPGSSI